MTTQFHLLKTKRFLPLFVTQFFNAFNDNVFKNALVILVTYKIAQSAASEQFLIAIAGGIFILPFFLLSATAGQIADKYEKSTIIKIIKSTEVLFMIIGSIGFFLNNLFLLFATLFFLGTHSTFFGPIKYSILPIHLHKNELIGGNGLIEAGTFVAILIGQVLGGSVILLNNGVSYITIALLSIAVLGLISSFLIPKALPGQPNLKFSFNIFKETWRIVNITRQKKDIFLAVLGISWFWFIGATFITQFPTLTKNTLSANESIFTLFLTDFSLGIGAGSLLCNRLLKGKISTKYVPLAILGMSVFIFDMYLATKGINVTADHLFNLTEFLKSPNNIRILIDVFLLTICGGLFIVPLYALIQERSDDAVRSRVIACNNIINAVFMVASALFIMLFTYLQFTIPQLFLIVAICNLFVALYICKLLPEAIIHSLVKYILQMLYRVEVKGLENYQDNGKPLMIIANHTSFLDAALLAAFIPHKLTFAINTHIAQKWWLQPISKIIDTISLDPTNPLAIKSLIKKVRTNHPCVIFPEGRLTMTGSLMKIYEGPGMVADQAQATILPVRIDGAQLSPFSRIKNKVRWRWFPKITLTILPATQLQVANEIKGRQRRQILGQHLYNLMSRMMFESSDYQKTLFQSLIEAKKIHSGRHDILEDIQRKSLNYATLIKSCFILSHYWQEQLTAAQNTGILLPNVVSNVINFFALQLLHKTPTMLNYTFSPQDIALCCQTTGIHDVITSTTFIKNAKLEKVVAALEAQNIQLHYLENIKPQITLKHKLLGMTKTLWPNLFYKARNQHQNPAVILFTSGSEGTAKGVVLSHENIQANRFQLSARIDFTAQDIILNALPMFHSFGLSAGSLLPILSGIKTFLYPSPLHYRIIPQFIYDLNATITFGTDTFLRGYARFANPYDFYSMRYVLAGAEKLKDETKNLWVEKFGIRILEGYGATETSPVLSMNTPMHYKAHTVGRFLPGIEYRLEAIPNIEQGGRLYVKGPNIMLGYLLADAPQQLKTLADGWYDTGDIVDVDPEGFITILGRVKRFAKIGGEMVSLGAIEQRLSALWPENHHAVIAVPSPQKGEQLLLFTTSPEITKETLIQHAKTHGLSEIQIPKKIVLLARMPLLGSGKIDYTSLSKIQTEQAIQESDKGRITQPS